VHLAGQHEQDLFAGGAVSDDALQVGGDDQLSGAELAAAARGCDIGQEAAAVGLVGGGGSSGDHGHWNSSRLLDKKVVHIVSQLV